MNEENLGSQALRLDRLRNWLDIILVLAGLSEILFMEGNPRNILLIRLMRSLLLARHFTRFYAPLSRLQGEASH